MKQQLKIILQRLAIVVCSVLMGTSIASSAPKTIKITNQTQRTLTAISGSETDAPTQIYSFSLAGSAGPLASVNATGELPATACVLDLTFTFASGVPIKREKIDLCSADGLVIE
jgi:hypothetical protein